jgi:small subunit ribosomal protein S2
VKAESKKPAVSTEKQEVKTEAPKAETKAPEASTTVFDSKQIEKEVKLKFDIPDVKEMLKAGVQFGHRVRRRDPRMDDFIFATKWDISIIDVTKTSELLEKALKFLAGASSKGEILFVATKRQAQDIVKKEAMRAGAHYIVTRWPGGLLSNFQLIKKSIAKLRGLEEGFERGVENRTKYEISLMKKQWERLNRLYAGIKSMEQLPKAVVIIDTNYERVALSEATKLGIPVVSVVDTNTNPELIDYPIPGNDDAIGSLEMFMKAFGDAVLQGNEGRGIKHDTKDYSTAEVKIIRKNNESEAHTEKVEEAAK